MKFSIITPTYNDASTIKETISSVLNQTYTNWELIISNDGSTDNTEKIVQDIIKKNPKKEIKYYYEENADQLNAILNVSKYISEDSYILILHSDDLLASSTTLETINNYFSDNKADAIIANLPLIDELGNPKGYQKTKKYHIKSWIPPLQCLWLGRNLYADTFVAPYPIFMKYIKENYLTWNMPFWLSYNEKVKMLNVQTVNFPIIKYRVFDGNYINNEIGKLNVINGELRTAVNLLKYYHLPCYRLQYNIFRLLNKLHLTYRPFYQEKQSPDIANIIPFIISKRFTNEEVTTKYLFLNNLIKFYQNYNQREIKITSISPQDFIYYGKDMHKFNKDMLSNNISPIYNQILTEMAQGFRTIIVQNEKDKETITIVTKFLCIYPFIDIKIK